MRAGGTRCGTLPGVVLAAATVCWCGLAGDFVQHARHTSKPGAPRWTADHPGALRAVSVAGPVISTKGVVQSARLSEFE